jgi:hypothetical protein
MSDGDKARQDAAAHPIGTGSTDLVTDSMDPETLQALLARARERLSFYEGFDQVIAENVRRSGELMHEALARREQASGERERAERDRSLALAALGELETGLEAIRAQVAILADRLGETRETLSRDTPEALIPAATSASAVEAPATETGLPTGPEPGDSAWSSPRVIDVIAHGVERAAVAVALQRYLGDLEPVVGVEAREFAEGMLRLRVTAARPLREADFTGWEAGRIGAQRIETNLVEIALSQ